jgi:hypothetical protein
MLNDQKAVQDIFKGMGITALMHLCVAIILTTMALVLWGNWQQALFWIPAGVFYVTAVLIKFFGEKMPFNISSTIVNLPMEHVVFFLTIIGIGLAVIFRSSDLAGDLVIGFSYLLLLFCIYKSSREAAY